jgi:hypothetical protein
MNSKAQQINHEVIGQHPSQVKGETMNTKVIKDSRKRFLSLTAVGLLTAVMSHAALADTVGSVGVSPNGRIIPAIIGDGGALCILKIVCNKSCLTDAKKICETQCGGRVSTCYSQCYMDYRGDCCEEVCEYR